MIGEKTIVKNEKVSCLLYSYYFDLCGGCARLVCAGRGVARVVPLSCEIACHTACYRLSHSVGRVVFVDWNFSWYNGRARGYELDAVVAVSAAAELLVECLLFRVA